MRLMSHVTKDHVAEAHRLFTISTMNTIQSKEMGFIVPQ
jgi:hypothetical protein